MNTKDKELVKLSIWVILLLLIIEIVFSMINVSCTLLNIMGIILFIVFIIISIKTKCLMNFKLKKNKNNCLTNKN